MVVGMCYHQNSGQDNNLLIADESSVIVVKFKYLRTTVINRNCIQVRFRECLLPCTSEYFVFPSSF